LIYNPCIDGGELGLFFLTGDAANDLRQLRRGRDACAFSDPTFITMQKFGEAAIRLGCQ